MTKVKRQVVKNRNATDARLSIDKARLDVQAIRKLEFSKDEKLWSVIKSSSVSSMLASKSTPTLPLTSYSANKLKEKSRIITQKAIHSPGLLLSGVRSSKDDMKYQIKAPIFTAKASTRTGTRYEAVISDVDDSASSDHPTTATVDPERDVSS